MQCEVSFFFNDTATTEIYTLSLHDALPISSGTSRTTTPRGAWARKGKTTLVNSPVTVSTSLSSGRLAATSPAKTLTWLRSEEHTSELQSRQYLVCRLLLEKKKHNTTHHCVR